MVSLISVVAWLSFLAVLFASSHHCVTYTLTDNDKLLEYSQWALSASFMLSLATLLLVVVDAHRVPWLTATLPFRVLLAKFLFSSIFLLLLLFIPLIFILSIVMRTPTKKHQTRLFYYFLASLVGLAIVLFVGCHVFHGIYDRQATLMSTWLKIVDIALYIDVVSRMGVVLIAVLSGTSAILGPYSQLRRFTTPIPFSVISALKDRLSYTERNITQREDRLRWLEAKGHFQSSNPWQRVTGFFQRTFSSTDEDSIESLREELVALESVRDQLITEVRELEAERQRHEFLHSTTRGRLVQVSGYLFAAYCLFKLFTSMQYLIYQNSGSFFPYLLTLFPATQPFAPMLSYLSLSAVLLLNLGAFLKTITPLIFSHRRGASSTQKLALLALLLPVYCLSLLVLSIDTALPFSCFQALHLHTLPIPTYIYRLHTWFLISALVTAIYLSLKRQQFHALQDSTYSLNDAHTMHDDLLSKTL